MITARGNIKPWALLLLRVRPALLLLCKPGASFLCRNCPDLLAVEQTVKICGRSAAHHAAGDSLFVGRCRRRDLGKHAARAARGTGSARQRPHLRGDFQPHRDALGVGAGLRICIVRPSISVRITSKSASVKWQPLRKACRYRRFFAPTSSSTATVSFSLTTGMIPISSSSRKVFSTLLRVAWLLSTSLESSTCATFWLYSSKNLS